MACLTIARGTWVLQEEYLEHNHQDLVPCAKWFPRVGYTILVLGVRGGRSGKNVYATKRALSRNTRGVGRWDAHQPPWLVTTIHTIAVGTATALVMPYLGREDWKGYLKALLRGQRLRFTTSTL